MKRTLSYGSIGLALALCASAAMSQNLDIRVPDGITSWTELKLYQARTLRNVNLSCIARYEKVFKPGSAENMLLMRSGGEWQETTIQKCEKDQNAPKDADPKCTYMTLKEYRDQGSPANSDSQSYSIPQLIPRNAANAWRGYIADDKQENQFPNFGKKGSVSTETGLDKAELGDIILMPKGAAKDENKPGLAKVAMVSEVNLGKDCEQRKDCYVQVLEPDNGKWPDVCGTTDTNGDTKTRYYYKPGYLPKPVEEEYKQIKSISSCEDTKLGKCTFELWDKVKLYRIKDDIREGCDKEKVEDCDDNQQGGGK